MKKKRFLFRFTIPTQQALDELRSVAADVPGHRFWIHGMGYAETHEISIDESNWAMRGRLFRLANIPGVKIVPPWPTTRAEEG